MSYTFGELVRLNNKIYRYAAPAVLTENMSNGSPDTTIGWVLFIDLDDAPFPFWTKIFNTITPSNNPGYFYPTNIECGSTYKDFYTFSNADGEEKSDWFNDIVIDNMQDIDYPNIVFIETQSDQTYNAHFVGQCDNLTILDNFADNGLIELLKNTFIGSNCKLNKIRQLNTTVIGNSVTQNVMTHRLGFNHYGYIVTGNHFLGECVGTTLDKFAQNIIGVDFSFNLALHGSYNTIGNFVWNCFLPTGFSNNQINCPAQDVYMPVVDNKQIVSDGFDYYVQYFDGTGYAYNLITPPSI